MLPSVNEPILINHRYVVEQLIGKGGMGAVYRATDRLTQQVVAIKRMRVALEHLDFASRSEHADERLALVTEFRTLASLRHPHIISVLDYGFDDYRQPYFTMELLDAPQTIVEAGTKAALPEKVALITAMFQALMYLHRRKVIHRDLKPDNVLVSNGRVRVLDFGIAKGHPSTSNAGNGSETGSLKGTLSYMAPERLYGEPAHIGADLFAAGIMVYEMFTGQYPFGQRSMGTVVNNILNKVMDAETIHENGVPMPVAAVLAKLLDKNPLSRFQSAEAAIMALCAATDQPSPLETSDIREGFLQSAPFVGRAAELAELSQAMEAAYKEKGSAFLIGGESGVGKSRLLEEIRIRGQIKGALILQGRAKSEASESYSVWRESMRVLALNATLDDSEANLLKELVPDLDALLMRDISGALQADSQTIQARLFELIARLLRQQKRLVMILLDDLQWAGSESLALLQYLSSLADTVPLLLIGNYRDDERPQLPAELPAMRPIRLKRLSYDDITHLSSAILGEAGNHPQVVTRLQKETEGNVFFLVEVVRAWAEEAGQLGQINLLSLPERTLTRGIENLIRRRLSRLTPEALEHLRMAAVIGRTLDLQILKRIDPQTDWESWVLRCADAAILELHSNQWQFAHDKLREGILAMLSDHEQTALHRQAAVGIEKEYADNPGWFAALAHHWQKVGEAVPELHYTTLAAREAIRSNASHEAGAYLRRALVLLRSQPETTERLTQEIGLLLDLCSILQGTQGYASPELAATVARARALCAQLGETPQIIPVLSFLSNYYGIRGEITNAREIADLNLDISSRGDDPIALALARKDVAWLLTMGGDAETAVRLSDQVLNWYNPDLHDAMAHRFGSNIEIGCLGYAAFATCFLGYPDKALVLAEQMVNRSENQDHLFTRALAYSLRAILHSYRWEGQQAIAFADQLEAFATRHNYPYMIGAAFLERAGGLGQIGEYKRCIEEGKRGLALLKDTGAQNHFGDYVSNMVYALLGLRRFGEAHELLAAGLAFAETYGERFAVANLYVLRGKLYHLEGDVSAAEADFETALNVARQQHNRWYELRSAVALANLWQHLGKSASVKTMLRPIYQQFTEGFDLLDLRSAQQILSAPE